MFTIVCACVIVFYLENTHSLFGKYINSFFPCVQKVENSAPCYAGYDMTIMIMVTTIGLSVASIYIIGKYKESQHTD